MLYISSMSETILYIAKMSVWLGVEILACIAAGHKNFPNEDTQIGVETLE